jgi:hypothetical protein
LCSDFFKIIFSPAGAPYNVLAKIQAMKAKIVIMLKEDGKNFQSEVQGNLLDVSMLVLGTMEMEQNFATAVLAAVEQYIADCQKQKTEKSNYHA